MCGQSRCQDQSCRNGADLEVMFGGGEDSAPNLRTAKTLEFYHKEVKKLTEQRGIYQFVNRNESPSRRVCLQEYQVATRIRHQSNRWLDVLKATMPRATAASDEHRNEYTSEMIEAELWQLQCGARIVSSRPRLI